MPYQCAHCRSIFFKTLESRILSEPPAILSKKRCKRCKQKVFLMQELSDFQHRPCTPEQWQRARKTTMMSRKIAERARTFASEYSRRLSRGAEDNTAYLARIEQAECRRATPHPHAPHPHTPHPNPPPQGGRGL